MFVDDGSTDGSTEICRDLVRRDHHVALVELRRRFGKATALQAGFGTARGDVIITMDADLQDDPKEIPRFLEGFERGFDLMCGWKEDRKDSLSKTLPSKLFNYVTSRTSGLKLQDFNCGFKAYKREVVQGLHLYGELIATYRYWCMRKDSRSARSGIPPGTALRASKYGIEPSCADRSIC